MSYLPALESELRAAGHDYQIVTKTYPSVLQKVEEMVLTQHLALMKGMGVKLLKQDKIDFIKEWRTENQALLLKEGLKEGSSNEKL